MDVREAVKRLTADSWDVYGVRPKSDDDEWFRLADKLSADGRGLAEAMLAVLQAIDQYEQDLKDRKHGGVAADQCIKRIQEVLNRGTK